MDNTPESAPEPLQGRFVDLPEGTISKTLLAAIVFFAMGIAALVVSASFYFLAPEPYQPVMGDYPSPRQVLNARPDQEGPAVLELGMVLVSGTRCIGGKEDVKVQSLITFIQTDPTGRVTNSVREPSYGRHEARQPGCLDQQSLILLPPAVTPGVWSLQGADIADKSGELRTWYSETFTVVAR